MPRILFALSFGFAALIAATQASHATPQCGPRAAVLDQLASRYAESRRGMGLAGDNTVMELFASEAGSWTITVTLPDGKTCLVASGLGYEPVVEPLPARGAPA